MPEEKEWIAYVNGEYVPQSAAKLSIFDHGVLFGDGVFDSWCAWNGYFFMLDEHIDRLYRSIHFFKIEMTLSKEELKKIVFKVVETNGAKSQYIKCIVTRGVGPRPLLSPVGCKASVVVFSRPYQWLSDSKEGRLVKARITNLRRTPPQCLDPKAKNLNYGNLVLAKMEALDAGADEAIMLDTEGFVNEGPGYNVLLVKEGKLYAPPIENVLPGITMQAVFEIAKKEGIEIITDRLVSYDVYNADEVFFASTAGGITAVGEVDGRVIGTGKVGPITQKIRSLLFEMMEKGIHGTPFKTK